MSNRQQHSIAFIIGCTMVLLSFHATAKDSLKRLDPPTTAPAFNLPDSDGKNYQLKDFAGKVLVVNFWATWCPPCRKEMPSMQRLWRELQSEGVELIAIDYGDPAEQVAEFAAETGIEFPLLLDPTGKVVREWGAIGLPTTYVVDRSGQIIFKAAGERDWDSPKIVETIRALARESS